MRRRKLGWGQPQLPWQLRLVLVASLLLALSLADVARGQGGPPEGPRAEGASSQPAAATSDPDDPAGRKIEAAARFFRGVEHTQNDSWDAALAEFLASRELYPGIASTTNAAIALRHLKRYAEALDLYQELLRDHEGELRDDERKGAQEALVQLGKVVGRIRVASTPSGASVVVDGKERGVTPLARPVVVNAGTHTVRVYRAGHVPEEVQLEVASEAEKPLSFSLRALRTSGRLQVGESTGKRVSVVLDGAVVGTTPWEGDVSPGQHTVALRGEGDLGSAPSAANVVAGRVARLSLTAIPLDAELRIEPTPSNARVDLDGVQISSGAWEGPIDSGRHTVEVVSPGFLAFRSEVDVRPGTRRVVVAPLRRDDTAPLWKERVFRPHVYTELVGGVSLSPSLGGSADGACGRGECSDETLASGFVGGARGGYQLTSGLGVELFLGVLHMQTSMVRTVAAQADGDVLATDYEDTTRLLGPFAALSASYSSFERTPLTFRVWLGAARMNAKFGNRATWVGEVERGTEVVRFSENVSIPEQSATVWMLLVGPEARFGVRVVERFTLDVGVAGLVSLATSSQRLGAGGGSQRQRPLSDVPGAFQNGTVDARPGLLRLPREEGLGVSLYLMPTLGARYDF